MTVESEKICICEETSYRTGTFLQQIFGVANEIMEGVLLQGKLSGTCLHKFCLPCSKFPTGMRKEVNEARYPGAAMHTGGA